MSRARGEKSVWDGFWDRFRSGYSEGLLVNFLAVLLVAVYFGTTSILPPLMFFAGLFVLGHLNPGRSGAVRSFLPAVGLSAAILLLAFVRSDFIDLLAHGMSLGQAYARSTRYFQAPMLTWFTTWALVFAAWGLREERAERIARGLGWLVIGLACVQLADAVTGMGLRNWINIQWFHGHRPERVVVDGSDFNTVLLMLFWPLNFWFMRRSMVPVVLMAAAIVWTAIVVDNNAQIIVLVASWIVFRVARVWPGAWSRRGILPERILAGLAAFWVMVFPALVLAVARGGYATALQAHLPPSWAARVEIWSYTVNRALEKPLFGWGYEAARRFAPVIPDHPHNMSLQAWLELGIPGLLLLAAFWFAVFWGLAPQNAEVYEAPTDQTLYSLDGTYDTGLFAAPPAEQLARPYMVATASAYFLLNAVSYGTWKAWFIGVGALALMAGILVIRGVQSADKFRI